MMDVIEQNLKRYLLGEMAESEQSALEAQYFADPQLFEQIVDAENQLVDSYARGEMPAELRTRFERSYLADPARHERVRFAAALTSRVDGREIAPQPVTSTSSWWQNALVSVRGLTPVFRYAIGFATLLVVLFGSWLVFNAWRRQRENSQIQANAAQKERERAEQAERERQQTPEVAGGPGETQPTPPPAPVPSVTPTPSPESGPSSVTLALTFGGVRGGGGGQTPTLTLSPATTQVRLALSLDDNDYATYRASLQTAAGNEIYSRTSPKPAGDRAHFVFMIPAHKFASGEYVLKLSGVNPDGEVDDLSKSPFRVVKK